MNKRVLIFLSLLMLFFQTAQTGEPPIPPVLTGGNVVLDTLGWLSADQETEINAINQKLDADNLAQIAVVTLDDCGSDKLKFRHNLFITWGIGHKNINDGLLILVCWYGGDNARRSIEQETGYGLESLLPSDLTARMAKDTFVPAFQNEQPGKGLLEMVRQYDDLLRKQPAPAAPAAAPPASTSLADPLIAFGVVGLLFLGVFVIMAGTRVSRISPPTRGTGLDTYTDTQPAGSENLWGQLLNNAGNNNNDSGSSGSDFSSFDGGDSGGGGSSTSF